MYSMQLFLPLYVHGCNFFILALFLLPYGVNNLMPQVLPGSCHAFSHTRPLFSAITDVLKSLNHTKMAVKVSVPNILLHHNIDHNQNFVFLFIINPGGYALALDMTARDFQDAAKKKGHPWSKAKGFNTACPISTFISKDAISDPQNLSLWCKVNGETKQDGNTKDMIFKIPTLVSYISRYFTLEAGDLVLTGTPSGVGPVVSGDVLTAGLGDAIQMSFTVN